MTELPTNKAEFSAKLLFLNKNSIKWRGGVDKFAKIGMDIFSSPL